MPRILRRRWPILPSKKRIRCSQSRPSARAFTTARPPPAGPASPRRPPRAADVGQAGLSRLVLQVLGRITLFRPADAPGRARYAHALCEAGEYEKGASGADAFLMVH